MDKSARFKTKILEKFRIVLAALTLITSNVQKISRSWFMSILISGSLPAHAIISAEKTVYSVVLMIFAQIAQIKWYLIVSSIHAYSKYAHNIHISQLTQNASLAQAGACTATRTLACSVQINPSISTGSHANLALSKTAPNVTLVGVTNIFG